MSSATRIRWPRLVLAVFVGFSVLGIAGGILASIRSGWVPPRNISGIVLPIYFGVLLAVLALTYVASGDTLMHHYRTGTVQRASEPVWFWRIVTVHLVLGIVLLVIGCFRWSRFHG